MKRLLVLAGVISVLGVAGCQDNATLKRSVDENAGQIAALQDQVNKLSVENAKLTRDLRDAANRPEVADKSHGELLNLREANSRLEQRIATLERRGVGGVTVPSDAPKTEPPVAPRMDDKEYSSMKAMLERYEAEKKERDKLDQERRMEEIAVKAKEYGLEFDPKDPAGSVRKIMMNRETRDKAFEAARVEARKERYKKIGVDEGQAMRLQQVEDDYRSKMGEIWRSRESDVPREERQRQADNARAEAESQVKSILSTDQYKTYSDLGGVPTPGPFGSGMEDLSRLFPGIQPEGGWGGQGRGPR